MIVMSKWLIYLALVWHSMSLVVSTSIWVDSLNGNDITGNGSRVLPFHSINYAIAFFQNQQQEHQEHEYNLSSSLQMFLIGGNGTASASYIESSILLDCANSILREISLIGVNRRDNEIMHDLEWRPRLDMGFVSIDCSLSFRKVIVGDSNSLSRSLLWSVQGGSEFVLSQFDVNSISWSLDVHSVTSVLISECYFSNTTVLVDDTRNHLITVTYISNVHDSFFTSCDGSHLKNNVVVNMSGFHGVMGGGALAVFGQCCFNVQVSNVILDDGEVLPYSNATGFVQIFGYGQVIFDTVSARRNRGISSIIVSGGYMDNAALNVHILNCSFIMNMAPTRAAFLAAGNSVVSLSHNRFENNTATMSPSLLGTIGNIALVNVTDTNSFGCNMVMGDVHASSTAGNVNISRNVTIFFACKVSCQPGSEQYGHLMCNLCSPGTFNPGGGESAHCISCPAGYNMSAVGASSCSPCPSQYYSHKTGSLFCDRCVNVLLMSRPGSASCTAVTPVFAAVLGISSLFLVLPLVLVIIRLRRRVNDCQEEHDYMPWSRLYRRKSANYNNTVLLNICDETEEELLSESSI